MKKIGIVGFSNLRFIPFIDDYITISLGEGYECELIYWNRQGEKETYGDLQCFSYDVTMKSNANIVVKLIRMLGFGRYSKNIIKSRKYDKVIILTTVPAIFISGFLMNSYNKNYILDIRDYSYEHIKIFYNRLAQVMKHSGLTIISSPGFKEFLPPSDLKLTHNSAYLDRTDRYEFTKTQSDKLIIGFMGVVRYVDQILLFIDTIGNHNQIEFHLYGDGEGALDIQTYCTNNNIENVTLHGKYLACEKDAIIQNCDIIYNCYGNNTKEVQYALSNKLYDALFYKKPILVNSKTIMQSYSEGINFIYHHDNHNFVNELLSWYSSIDQVEFTERCECLLNQVNEECKIYRNSVSTFLKGELND